MNCEDSFKRLYSSLNGGIDDISSEQMQKHFDLCKTCCDYCKFNQEVTRAIQSGLYKKASPELKNRIIRKIRLSEDDSEE